MAENHQPSPWWSPGRHADVRPFLMARGAIIRAVRAWFDEQGFVEVETGILQVSPGNETHLHAPRTELTGPDGTRAIRYMRTSPEFAAKKLLAAGLPKLWIPSAEDFVQVEAVPRLGPGGKLDLRRLKEIALEADRK